LQNFFDIAHRHTHKHTPRRAHTLEYTICNMRTHTHQNYAHTFDLNDFEFDEFFFRKSVFERSESL
jgi:hypothetical protein